MNLVNAPNPNLMNLSQKPVLIERRLKSYNI